MLYIDGAVLDFKQLDRLAEGNTGLHQLDPRAKVAVTLIFIVSVVSFGRYEISPLLPFFVYPAVLVALAKIPIGFIARKVLVVLPFAFVVGMFNPLFDRSTLMTIGTLAFSGGMISWLAIIIKAILTVSAALILVATTGFPSICRALEQMGMPQAFAVQLMFLYRYIFVLTEEGGRASRARELRSFGNKGRGVASYGSLIGHLLLRTWQRAERIHMAMLARGFNGEFRTLRSSKFGWSDTAYLVGWVVLFIVIRLYNIPLILGSFATGMLP